MKEVMERLADQEVKHPPPGIALGKAVKPMKAAALQHRRGAKRGAHLTPEEIFEEMTARSCATRLLAENKFDG